MQIRAFLIGALLLPLTVAHAQQRRRMLVVDSLRVPDGTIAVAATNQETVPVVIRTRYGAAMAGGHTSMLMAFADSVDLIINAHDARASGDTLVYSAIQAGLRFYRTIDDRSDRFRIVAANGVGSDELVLTREQSAKIVSMIRRAIEVSNAMPPNEPYVKGHVGQVPQAPVVDEQIYFAFQVEHQARIIGEKPTPRYPAMLKSANVGGEVLAQFFVDTTGHVETGSFKVLRSPHELFTQSVKELLPSLRFTPAELRGAKVRQVVQMPFAFTP